MGSAGGRFITLEGGEGAGKSTQARDLAEALQAAVAAPRVVLTREPGAQIRALLVDGAPERWSAQAEALLFNAARTMHVEEVIRPALEAGAWVICDRFTDSTLAYQGAGRGLDRRIIADLNRLATGDVRPDLTLILDLDPAAGLARALARGPGAARYEHSGLDFHKRVRTAFAAIAAAEPGRCAVIDAARPRAEVAAAIRREVAARFPPDAADARRP